MKLINDLLIQYKLDKVDEIEQKYKNEKLEIVK